MKLSVERRVGRDVLEWLLETDPALRWQVERDLADAPEHVWRETRERTAHEGYGARLLALQDDDGQWSGGASVPAPGSAGAPEPGDPERAWTATTWALNALRQWGVPVAALGDTADRLEKNCRWEYGDMPFWVGEIDVCNNAFTLSNGVWLGRDMSDLAQWFVEHQVAEGGWNCDWVEGSTRASVHSTLNALVGLLDVERKTGGTDAIRAARAAAEDYLLQRALTYRASTGEPIVRDADHFTYPVRWRYSLLRALDYFRAANRYEGGDHAGRLGDAIDIVESLRQPDGRWLQGPVEPGRVWFTVDVPEGQASPWLTFYALRILRWWDEV
ncbi:squalene cyclase [Microbacterium amylolyticum]|uniref:Squalene cyclase n=1 Tax=Microbacterium amylolyticum TaxID=936337 RepID=A0ABS4ZI17_9MICO|nr:squalene cyclase [Microbacterium amylolyticum]MBP2436698.1 hypothetical protein [Microbacterium amylolyticum]